MLAALLCSFSLPELKEEVNMYNPNQAFIPTWQPRSCRSDRIREHAINQKIIWEINNPIEATVKHVAGFIGSCIGYTLSIAVFAFLILFLMVMFGH